MGQAHKRFDILNMAKETGVVILCLQETYLTSKDYTTVKNEWNADIFINGKLTNAVVVCTIVEKYLRGISSVLLLILKADLVFFI